MAGIFLCVIIVFTLPTLYVHHNKSKPNKHIMNAGLPHQIVLCKPCKDESLSEV